MRVGVEKVYVLGWKKSIISFLKLKIIIIYIFLFLILVAQSWWVFPSQRNGLMSPSWWFIVVIYRFFFTSQMTATTRFDHRFHKNYFAELQYYFYLSIFIMWTLSARLCGVSFSIFLSLVIYILFLFFSYLFVFSSRMSATTYVKNVFHLKYYAERSYYHFSLLKLMVVRDHVLFYYMLQVCYGIYYLSRFNSIICFIYLFITSSHYNAKNWQVIHLELNQ